MKNNKFSYLLIAATLFYLTGCEGSDPVPESTEKMMPVIRLQSLKKRKPGKEDHLRQEKKPLEKAITKTRPMSGQKKSNRDL